MQNGKINYKNLHKILLARKYQSIDYSRYNNYSSVPDSHNSDISLHLGENDYSIFAQQQFGSGKKKQDNKIGDLMRT